MCLAALSCGTCLGPQLGGDELEFALVVELEAALGALRRLVRDAVVEEARLGDLLGRPLLQLLLELLAPNRPDVRLKHVSAA